MSEIKFRVWDTNNNKWFHSGQRCCHISYTTENFGLNKRFVFQQYTGLNDALGRKIYEGDIVQFNLWNPLSAKQEYLLKGNKVVKWSLDIGRDYPFAGFTFININSADLEIGCLVDCMNIQNCEIIGHIYDGKKY